RTSSDVHLRASCAHRPSVDPRGPGASLVFPAPGSLQWAALLGVRPFRTLWLVYERVHVVPCLGRSWRIGFGAIRLLGPGIGLGPIPMPPPGGTRPPRLSTACQWLDLDRRLGRIRSDKP